MLASFVEAYARLSVKTRVRRNVSGKEWKGIANTELSSGELLWWLNDAT